MSWCSKVFISTLVISLSCSTQAAEPENISQLLHCLAIVNGAPVDGTSVSEELRCPDSQIAPIRFSKGDNLSQKQQQEAVKALARALRSEAAKGLAFRLVGHSDGTGTLEEKTRTSLRRAQALQGALGKLPVKLVTEGRSDSEPFGNEADLFNNKDVKEGGCKYGNTTVNCDRRIGIEVITPLVARYGALPVDRAASSLIAPDNGPHVRFFPDGVAPGQVVSIDLASLEIPGFSPQWHQDCHGKKTDWMEFASTKSLFDNKAGKLWGRLRIREVVGLDNKKSKEPTIQVIFDVAANANPESAKYVLEPSYPDYWALHMRTQFSASGDKTALLSLFDQFRETLDKSTETGENISATPASSCMSTLLDKDNKISVEKIYSSLENHIPLHGDDRLAQAYGPYVSSYPETTPIAK